jgi:hypothetical protein
MLEDNEMRNEFPQSGHRIENDRSLNNEDFKE